MSKFWISFLTILVVILSLCAATISVANPTDAHPNILVNQITTEILAENISQP